MENLLKETQNILEQNGKTLEDIRWVGSRDCLIELDKIKEIFNFEYNDGYGAAVIVIDLLVVGDDWWLERHEYDGSEWWEFKSIPQKPTRMIKNAKINGGMWDSLAQLNGVEL